MKQYVLMNILFAVAIYLGFYSDLDNGLSAFALSCAYGMAWYTIVLGLGVGWFMFDDMVAKIRTAEGWQSNRVFDILYDMAIIAAFAGAGMYVIALLYAAQTILFNHMYSIAHKLNLKEQK
jgi:hypothetical protein